MLKNACMCFVQIMRTSKILLVASQNCCISDLVVKTVFEIDDDSCSCLAVVVLHVNDVIEAFCGTDL